MTTIMPEGENLKKAVKWILEEKESNSSKNLSKIVGEACMKFDLSPREAEFLSHMWLKQNE